MIGYRLALFALGASTALATPLAGSLWRKSQITSRDANEAKVEQTPTCHNDNLYRVFTSPDNNAAASAFCSVYIATTSLVMSTVTPTYTASVILPPAGLGAFDNDSGDTPSITTSSCNYTATTPLSVPDEIPNATVTASLQAKRQLLPGMPGPMIPAAVTASSSLPGMSAALGAGTNSSLPLSSVCSCLLTTASTTTVTWTVSALPIYTTMTFLAEGTGVEEPTGVVSALSTSPAFPTSNGPLVTLPTVASIQNVTYSITATSSLSSSSSVGEGGEQSTTSTSSLSSSSSVDTVGEETATASSLVATSTGASSSIVPFANGTSTAATPGPTGATNGTGSAPYCSETFVRGNGSFNARYMVRCAYSYANLEPATVDTEPSFASCVTRCDEAPRCFICAYEKAATENNCLTFDEYPPPSGVPDYGWDSATYVVGSNNGMKH